MGLTAAPPQKQGVTKKIGERHTHTRTDTHTYTHTRTISKAKTTKNRTPRDRGWTKRKESRKKINQERDLVPVVSASGVWRLVCVCVGGGGGEVSETSKHTPE